jgi:hypothetical protein
MVNEVHNNPMDIGINRFFTQGTVFLRNNFLSVISPSYWILKTDNDAKYYPTSDNASNKDLFYRFIE